MIIQLHVGFATSRVTVVDSDGRYVGALCYTTYQSAIDRIICNLSPIEAVLPNDRYRLDSTNQVKIYRMLLDPTRSNLTHN